MPLLKLASDLQEVQYLGQHVAPSVLRTIVAGQLQRLLDSVMELSKQLEHFDPSRVPVQVLQPGEQFLQTPRE